MSRREPIKAYFGIETHEEFPEYVIVSPMWESDKREPRRYVPERTCKNLLDDQPDSFKCSECGGVLDGVVFDPSEGAYCTYCGAKVVE